MRERSLSVARIQARRMAWHSIATRACMLFPGGADKIDLMARLAKPFASAAHPFGTDPLGRDVMARVAAGGKISLLVGVTSVLGAVVLGVLVGLVAGYYRGFWDMTGIRVVDMKLPPEFAAAHPGPQFGVAGSRRLTGVEGRPIIGTIVKPALGLRPEETAALVGDLLSSGVDFIKDDEKLMG